MVQRRAARWVTGRYHNTSSVSDMLCSLDWRSLEQRRVDSRLIILYKLRNPLVATDENFYLQRTTRRRRHQYRQLRADKDYTRFSFFSQDSHTVQPASKPNLPDRSRRSSTLDSISPKNFSYLFVFLLLFPIPYSNLTNLFRYFFYHFPLLALHW